MIATLATAALSAALGAIPVVAPPSSPGSWRQVGAPAVSKAGKPLHFDRTALGPSTLAFVVSSAPGTRLTVAWFSYCEFQSDDEITAEHQGTATGVGSVSGSPPVFDGATRCDVAVSVKAVPGGTIAAALFAS